LHNFRFLQVALAGMSQPQPHECIRHQKVIPPQQLFSDRESVFQLLLRIILMTSRFQQAGEGG